MFCSNLQRSFCNLGAPIQSLAAVANANFPFLEIRLASSTMTTTRPRVFIDVAIGPTPLGRSFASFPFVFFSFLPPAQNRLSTFLRLGPQNGRKVNIFPLRRRVNILYPALEPFAPANAVNPPSPAMPFTTRTPSFIV